MNADFRKFVAYENDFQADSEVPTRLVDVR
jgi:hypothetical protein